MPAAVTGALPSVTVSIAPLILLSACDHYGRSAKGTRKRVVGVLLGQNTGSTVRVTNSFAGMSFSMLWFDGFRMCVDVVVWIVLTHLRPLSHSSVRGGRQGPRRVVP